MTVHPPASDLDLTGMLALAAVGTSRTVQGASTDLGVPAATVVDRIRRLERATGHELLAPGDRLSRAGRLLAEHAAAIAGALATARAELAALRAGRYGTPRLTVADDVPERFTAALLAELAAGHGPHPARDALACTARTVPDRSVALNDLDADESDAVLVTGGPPRGAGEALAGTLLLDDPWVLVVAAGSPWAERAAPPSAAEVDALTRVGGTGATAQALVAAGLGVAVLPRTAIDAGHPGTVAIELPHRPRLALSLVWRADAAGTAPVALLRGAAAATGARLAAHRALLAAAERQRP